MALLVGCTEYKLLDTIPELYGPANDVPKFADRISANSKTDRIGFRIQKQTG
jgi:hypothetical protein